VISPSVFFGSLKLLNPPKWKTASKKPSGKGRRRAVETK
jgi:hypothetical protein